MQKLKTNKKFRLQDKINLYSMLKKSYERLLRIRGKPNEIALGFALGIFIGLTPTMGFQIVAVVFLATLLKWNRISAVIGVWISNPVTAPFIYSLTYLVGAWVLDLKEKQEFMGNIEINSFFKILSKAPDFFWAMTIGGIIIGVPLTIMAYYFSFSAVKKYQDGIKEKLARQKERIIKKKMEKKLSKKQAVAKKEMKRKTA